MAKKKRPGPEKHYDFTGIVMSSMSVRYYGKIGVEFRREITFCRRKEETCVLLIKKDESGEEFVVDHRRDYRKGERLRVVGKRIDRKYVGDRIQRYAYGMTTRGYGSSPNTTKASVILAKSVERCKEAFVVTKQNQLEFEGIMREAKDDPRGEFLVVTTRLEHLIKAKANEKYPESSEFIDAMSVPQVYDFGSERGLFPSEHTKDLKSVWRVRNQVTHTRTGQDVEAAEIVSLTHIGAMILLALSDSQ